MKKPLALYLLIASLLFTFIACKDPPKSTLDQFKASIESGHELPAGLPEKYIEDPTIPERVREARKSVIGVTVVIKLNQDIPSLTSRRELVSRGSGFFIESDIGPDIVISARHVLIDPILDINRKVGLPFALDNGIPKSEHYSYYLYGTNYTTRPPENFYLQPVSIGTFGEHQDYMALRVYGYDRKIKPLTLRSDVKLGDQVFISGYVPIFSFYPNSLGGYEKVQSNVISKIFKGKLSKIIDDLPINKVGSIAQYEIEINCEFGYSGGPVLNSEGEVIGMTIEKLSNFVQAVSAKDIIHFAASTK